MEYNQKFLILFRKSNKPDGNSWGLPAGKVEEGETTGQSVLREIYEETGYTAAEEELEFLGNYQYDFPEFFLEFFTYRIFLKEPFEVQMCGREHSECKYVSAQECYALPNLIRGLHDLLERVGYIK